MNVFLRCRQDSQLYISIREYTIMDFSLDNSIIVLSCGGMSANAALNFFLVEIKGVI